MSILEHKKCSGFKGKLKTNLNYRCKRCMEYCRAVDSKPEKHVILKGMQLDAVESFRYLGCKISPGGGCELATNNVVEMCMAVVSEVFYFMLANVEICREKCKPFCVKNKAKLKTV